MGFPGETADWASIEGAFYMGFGTSMPGIFSAIAIAACVVVLLIGNASEQKSYKK